MLDRTAPTELIDLGDRVVLLANMPMRAQASGVPLAETYAVVSTLKDGKVRTTTIWIRPRLSKPWACGTSDLSRQFAGTFPASGRA